MEAPRSLENVRLRLAAAAVSLFRSNPRLRQACYGRGDGSGTANAQGKNMNPTFARALGVERLSVVNLKVAETKASRLPTTSRDTAQATADLRGKVAAG